MMEYAKEKTWMKFQFISQIVDIKRYHISTRWGLYHINSFVETVSEQIWKLKIILILCWFVENDYSF